jgi:membrane protease YdiL (CAAX protease family)
MLQDWPSTATPSSSSASTTASPPPPAPPLAPTWHTAALIVFLIALAIYGAFYGPTVASSAPYTLRMLISSIQRLFLLGAVVGGIYHRSTFLQSTLTHRARPWTNEFGTGIIVYIMGLTASISAVFIRFLLHRPTHEINPGLLAVIPHTPAQLPAWLLVSLVAGVGEEIIFRGYLLRQFTAWTGRVPIAIAAISLIFGVMHLYEGLPVVVALMLLSALYCIVTLHRGNLRAVIIAHTLQDFFAGVVGLMMPHIQHFRHHA